MMNVTTKYLGINIRHNLLILISTATLLIIAFPSVTLAATGFNTLKLPLWDNKQMTVAVWYPSDTSPTPPESNNLPFTKTLAVNSDISVSTAPLIILSHGYGGWMGSHADTALALAEAGFVVAAPSHTGNTYTDMSSPVDQWLIDRPKHISILIDHLLNQWPHRAVLQNSSVGVFGFSAGGQTALSLIGAVPSLDVAKAHCEAQPKEFVCREGMIKQALSAAMQTLPASEWGADPRVKAAVIAAPGLGIAYDKKALSNVKTPVQIWSGLEDNRVPHNSNAKPIAKHLGALAQSHWVKGASHFSFMIQSCSQKLKQFEPETWAFLCVDKEGFNRWEFHRYMNTEIVRFFKKHL